MPLSDAALREGDKDFRGNQRSRTPSRGHEADR
jgi:hypothetical protein